MNIQQKTIILSFCTQKLDFLHAKTGERERSCLWCEWRARCSGHSCSFLPPNLFLAIIAPLPCLMFLKFGRAEGYSKMQGLLRCIEQKKSWPVCHPDATIVYTNICSWNLKERRAIQKLRNHLYVHVYCIACSTLVLFRRYSTLHSQLCTVHILSTKKPLQCFNIDLSTELCIAWAPATWTFNKKLLYS